MNENQRNLADADGLFPFAGNASHAAQHQA
jgi:hypothetical protein